MLVSGRVVEMIFFSDIDLKLQRRHRDMSCMDTAYVRDTPPPKKKNSLLRQVQDSCILGT